jgi:hypothetical protein
LLLRWRVSKKKLALCGAYEIPQPFAAQPFDDFGSWLVMSGSNHRVEDNASARDLAGRPHLPFYFTL